MYPLCAVCLHMHPNVSKLCIRLIHKHTHIHVPPLSFLVKIFETYVEGRTKLESVNLATT